MQTSEKTDYQEVVREVAITPKLVLVILGPYFLQRVWAQVTAVLPISLFLFVFQVLVLRQPVSGGLAIAAGLTAVVLGLMFFMEGLKLGLMPLGESIGATMPAKATISLVLGFAFVLGVGATFAEPAISTLKAAGANVKPQDAPLLYEMLNRSSHLLVGSVGFGVGIATVLGVYRFVRQWRLRTLLLPSLFLPLTLTVIAAANEETRHDYLPGVGHRRCHHRARYGASGAGARVGRVYRPQQVGCGGELFRYRDAGVAVAN